MIKGRGKTLIALAVAVLVASALGRFGVHFGVAELNFAW
jgi:hypothetical protein